MAITHTVEAEFSTGVWTEITEDILSDYGIDVKQGIQGNGPADRVASTGTMQFSLDNSKWNSGGLAGYYTPGHTNCRSGFEEGLAVRLYMTNGVNARYIFYGLVTDINPVPGKFGPLRTDITVCDYINTLATKDAAGMAVLSDVTTDSVLTALVAAITAPLNSSYETGPDTFPYAGHSESQRTKALTIAQKLVQSDLGYIVVDNTYLLREVFTYKNRHKRFTRVSAATLTETDITNLVVSRSKDKVYNSISVTVYPVRVDTSPVVLGEIQNEIEIAPGETLEIKLSYKDPTQPAVRVSASSIITPVEDTDYKMSSMPGGGNTLNAYLSITLDDGASESTLTLENTGTRTGYINLLQVRGYGFYFDDPITITEESGDADRPLKFNLPYQSDPVKGQSLAQRLLRRYGTAITQAEAVSFEASTSTLEGHIISRNLLNRITLSESQAGISGDYFIQSMHHKIGPKGVVSVTWGLDWEPDVDNYWKLETVGHSELGTTTYLVI